MTRIAVVNEHAPRVLSEIPGAETLRITLDGEDVSRDVNEGLTFSNADPGGFEVCAFSLPRDVRVPRGRPIRITEGLEVAWEGRVAEAERSLGSGAGASHETSISGEGYGARLRDTDMSMIYVDRDLTAWEEMSQAYVLNRLELGLTIKSSELRGGADGIPAISTRIERGAVGAEISDAMYDAGEGNLIASMWLDAATELSGSGGNWHYDGAASHLVGFNAEAVFSGEFPTNSYWTLPTGKRYARVQFYADGSAPRDEKTHGVHWRNLTAYGNHGLAPRGSTNPVGYYTSDIIGHVIDQLPGIARGDIQTASGFVVPHASYRVPVAHEQIVTDMNGYVGWHWGTWEARGGALAQGLPRFDFRLPPSAKTVWASRRDMDGLQLIERLSELFNRVRVAYDDPSGKRRSASMSFTVPELDAAGISSRTLPLEIGVSTQTAAAAMASVVANLLLDRTRRIAGTASMRGRVGTPAGSKPALLLRAGLDRLGIPDLPTDSVLSGTDNEIHIRRVETTVGREGPSTSLELGAGADLLEVLTARVESRTSVVTGGG